MATSSAHPRGGLFTVLFSAKNTRKKIQKNNNNKNNNNNRRKKIEKERKYANKREIRSL